MPAVLGTPIGIVDFGRWRRFGSGHHRVGGGAGGLEDVARNPCGPHATNPALARHTAEFVDEAASSVHLGVPVTDKITSHSYETMYSQFLLPLRDGLEAAGRRLKMLEIGMGCDMARGSPGCMSLKPSSHIAHVSIASDHSPAMTGKSTSCSLAVFSAAPRGRGTAGSG